MKFTSVIAILAAAAAVSASAPETNAQRMARGLPPKAPKPRRATPVALAERGRPSNVPGGGHGHGQCSTGSMQCCNSTTRSQSKQGAGILGLLGLEATDDFLIGLSCDPLGALGANSCTQQPVCCQGNNYKGLIVLGCSPINVNL